MGHKTEDLKVAQNNDFVINILTNFYNKMKKSNDDQLKNFKGKINDIDKLIDDFFDDECKRVSKNITELINLLNNLNSKIMKLISMYQKKFKDEFVAVKEDYDRFQDEIQNRIYYLKFI